MVAPKMFFEEFSRRFPRRGKLITDVQNKSSIDLAGFTKRVHSVYRYFGAIPHSPGDKAVLFLENSIDSMAVLLALFDTDLVLVPLNPRLDRAKTAYLARHSRSKFLITSQGILDRNGWLKELPCRTVLTDEIFRSAPGDEVSLRVPQRRPRKEDLKFILYTSGTIGNPKGVMLSRESVRLKILSLIDLLDLRPGTAFFSFLPFFSGHGMIPGMLVPFLSGCRMHIARFDPFLGIQFWGMVKKYGIRCFTAVPGILALLKEHIGGFRKKDLKCLRTVFSASSQLPQAVYDWYAGHLGISIRNCYGLTETASWISVSKGAGKGGKAHCIGKALGPADIGVFDEQGKRLGPDETGEFRVRSPYNMSGYFRNRKETRSCMAGGGFIRTGDTGFIDPKGKIFFLDRIKQIILKNGINVYPLEIDQVFLEHPGVKDSVSFGVPDERYGEAIITALRVRDPQRSKGKYYRYAMKKLPAFLVPQDIFFPEDLPRGVTGKVKVESLRKQYLEERK